MEGHKPTYLGSFVDLEKIEFFIIAYHAVDRTVAFLGLFP